jgi:L-alanine-DL-glutamate epimerase-like enolase superfamily enzyme
MPDGERALADANGGLDVESAVAVSKALDGIDVLIEEPCSTFEENLEVARRVDHGVVLDQCMSSLQLYARAVGEGVFAGVGIKPTNLGGLTPARAARDLCLAAGLPMKIDDSWAADVGSLAALHLAAGVPAELLIATVDMRGYFDGAMFSGGPREGEGEICLNDAAGLGITPLPNSFGEPVFAAGA